MADMWSGIGNYFQNLVDKSIDYEQEWQNYLFPADPSAQGATGYPSNVRHAAASSALSNIIKNKMHNMFATPGYEDQKPSGLFNLAGKMGAFFPMMFHEIPQDNTYSLAYEAEPWNQVSPAHPSGRHKPDLNPLPPKKNLWQNQFTEDMLANLFGLIHGGESEDPNVEAEALTPKLAYNKGLINNALLNIAKTRNYSTRYDLQSELEQPVWTHHDVPSNRNDKLRFMDMGMGWRHRMMDGNQYPGSNKETVITRGNNFAAGQVPRRVKPQAPPGQPVTGRHIGYNAGGIVSLVL